VRVDVYSLVVKVCQAGDAAGEGIGGGAVAGMDVVVVALPEGEIFPGHSEGGDVSFGCGAFLVVGYAVGRHCFFFRISAFVLGFPVVYVEFKIVGIMRSSKEEI